MGVLPRIVECGAFWEVLETIELSIFGLALIIMGAADRTIDGITRRFEYTGYTFFMYSVGLICIMGSLLYEFWEWTL